MAKRRSLTPFFDALSDLRVREKIKQQEISKLFEFDKFEGKTIFKAKVLTGCETGHQREDPTDPDNLYFPIVLRILDISDSIIPDPKDATTTEEKNFLIGNHPIAYSDRPYNTKLGFVPRAGQIVDCYYRDPVNKRNLVYIYPQEDSIQDEVFCGGASSLRDSFGAGTGILGDTIIPEWSGQPEGWTALSGVVVDENSGRFMNKLAANLTASGFTESLEITSMRRTPASQARAMVKKMNLGDDLLYLYNDSLMNEIFTAVKLVNAGISNKVKPVPAVPASSGPVYEAAKAVLEKQVARGAYISNHMRPEGKSGIDIRVKYWDNYKDPSNPTMAKVQAEIKRLGGTSEFETAPYHLHVSVPEAPAHSEGDIVIADEQDQYATSDPYATSERD